jgi:signal recognition particle subunit SEC65
LKIISFHKSENEIARLTNTSRTKGCSEENMIKVAKKLGLKGYVKEDMTLKELKEYVEDLGVELEMNETKKPVKEGEDIFADIEDDLMHGTDSKRDQIEYLQEVIDWCQNKIEKIKDTNMDEAMGGKNPEGDKLVLRFLKGVAKKFDYPVAQAAIFVKDTIKSLGY